ncbi:acyl-CoA dehydrogenase family protein [Hoeflea poritis]|uniref:Acyl-CoA dehydrogenase family protein n=1 Tax=Hoeflea poritis TaxID=2993659 RepID=A0ABT4VKE4_9HYPH|nr:acyl-CoA dehydrogenase family protein [Hoeflea poritis]MDA4845125.1 acyl-CoA dehydrogenase family protein [Hoeflea poritis]
MHHALTTDSGSFPITTHEVLNQSGPFVGVNIYDGDAILSAAVEREGGGWVTERASALGAAAGDPEVQEHSYLANKHGPVLRTHDRFGNRIDAVDFHPSYHALMQLAFGSGVHALSWTEPREGAHVARAALSFVWNQIESGIGCPTGMAYSSVPTLRKVPEIDRVWTDKIIAQDYDPRPIAVGEKQACTIGMALTEKQGGSDLRANSTFGMPAGLRGEGQEYRLTGHKWFCSAPMSDAFLTLAQTDNGPSLFFVPRSLPDGTRNRFFIQRLKDKAGNRSNASSEIEYEDTFALLIGEEGRGIRAAMEMAHLTRLDFSIGSAGLMRWALNLTLHHTHHRRVFQRTLAEQPLMENVLADLCLEVEAATLLGFALAGHIDRADLVERDRLLERLVTPAAKFWNCKRAPAFVAECLECHGGNGFIEEQPMPRLYREAPLNGIWEGTGNVVCLDVERVLTREPDAFDAFMEELRTERGSNATFDHYVDKIGDLAIGPLQGRMRQLTIAMATAYEGLLFLRHSSTDAAALFIESRLGNLPNRAFGSLPADARLRGVIRRTRVA